MKLIGIFTAGLLLTSFCNAQDEFFVPLNSDLQSEGISRGPYEHLQTVKSPPQTGTFYSLQLTNFPPLPFNPFPEFPVYAWGDAFLFDDWEVDWVAIQEQGVSLFGTTDSSSKDGSMQMMSSSVPAPPGDGGGGTNEGWPTNSTPAAYSYSSSELWLEITCVTNDAAYFVIHPPDTETNVVYDLFTTTNLTDTVPGLNLTNWMWLLRTANAQTNIVLANLWPTEGWFRLGTMLDSDGDGMTDAYEKLVNHTDHNNADTDGDGVIDQPFKVIVTRPGNGGVL